MNEPNATKLFTLKWLVLWYVNFISINDFLLKKKEGKMTKTKATVKSRKKRMEKFPFVLKRAVGSVVGRGQIAVG